MNSENFKVVLVSIIILIAIVFPERFVAIADDMQLILNEGSLWRGWITRMPAITKNKDGNLIRASLTITLKEASALPLSDWKNPDFDDSGWFYWRESRPLRQTIKLKDSNTEIPVYDRGQYGIQRSIYMGLRCFRGKFCIPILRVCPNYL